MQHKNRTNAVSVPAMVPAAVCIALLNQAAEERFCEVEYYHEAVEVG